MFRYFNVRLLRQGTRTFSGAISPTRTETTKRLWEMRQFVPDKEHAQLEGSRSPSFSSLSLDLDFANNEALRNQYENFKGAVRLGKIFEDLDACAGNVAHLHAYSPSAPKNMKVVTVAVDSIHVFDKISLEDSLLLNGRVSWVGNSSMEICVSLEHKNKKQAPLIQAYVLMAARLENKSFQVPELILETSQEKKEFNSGHLRNQARKQERKNTAVDNVLETFTSNRKISLSELANRKIVYVKDAKSQSVVLTEPQERNTAGKVFGGFLMQKAYELAFANVIQVTGCVSPIILGVDDISFINPVEIASIITFNSVVSFSDPSSNTYQVCVTTDVLDLKTKSNKQSNVFHFSFECESNVIILPTNESQIKDIEMYFEGEKRLESLKNAGKLMRIDHEN